MKFNKLNLNRFAIFLFPVLILVVGSLLTVTVIIPQIDMISQNREQLTLKREELDKLTKKRKMLETITLGSMPNLLNDAEAGLPDDKDVTSVIAVLENLAKETKVILENISFVPGIVSSSSAKISAAAKSSPVPQPIQTSGLNSRFGSQYTPVEVQIKSEETDFRQFLNRINNVRRIFDVSVMGINFSEDNKTVNAKISLIFYYQPAQTVIDQSDLALIEITPEETKSLESLGSMAILNNLPGISEIAGSVPVRTTGLFNY